MSAASAINVTGVLRLRLCTSQAESLANFYESALGFRRLGVEDIPDARVQTLFHVDGRARRVTVALGNQHVELIEFVDDPGRPYPADTAASDLIFQHFALVVSDMDAAIRQLSACVGWLPISADGPQLLPPSSGGVTAFKFRDPQGHPLELLYFPPGKRPQYWQHQNSDAVFMGIDHSAISVSDTASSVTFYAALGLSVDNRSLNKGPAQARLDGVRDPVAEVTAMAADGSTPHLELLCYRGPEKHAALDLRANDVAASCVVWGTDDPSTALATAGASVRRLLDPDGHHLWIESPAG